MQQGKGWALLKFAWKPRTAIKKSCRNATVQTWRRSLKESLQSLTKKLCTAVILKRSNLCGNDDFIITGIINVSWIMHIRHSSSTKPPAEFPLNVQIAGNFRIQIAMTQQKINHDGTAIGFNGIAVSRCSILQRHGFQKLVYAPQKEFLHFPIHGSGYKIGGEIQIVIEQHNLFL